MIEWEALALFVTVLFQAMDVWTTHLGLSMGARERNGLMKLLMQRLGFFGAAAFKMLFVLGLLAAVRTLSAVPEDKLWIFWAAAVGISSIGPAWNLVYLTWALPEPVVKD